MQLSNKVLGERYVKERFKSSLRKFYGRYGDFAKQYEGLSPEWYTTFWRITIYSDTLHWWDITPIFLPFTDLDLITEFDFLPNCVNNRTLATGAACQQRTLTPPGTTPCPTLGLVCIVMSRTISPELVLFPYFWVSNIPRYFYFALHNLYV